MLLAGKIPLRGCIAGATVDVPYAIGTASRMIAAVKSRSGECALRIEV